MHAIARAALYIQAPDIMFQIITFKTEGEVADTRTLQCHVYKTKFHSKLTNL